MTMQSASTRLMLILPFVLLWLPFSETCSPIPPSASCLLTFYSVALSEDAEVDTNENFTEDVSCRTFPKANETYQPAWTPIDMFYDVCNNRCFSHFGSTENETETRCCLNIQEFNQRSHRAYQDFDVSETVNFVPTHVQLHCTQNPFVPPRCPEMYGEGHDDVGSLLFSIVVIVATGIIAVSALYVCVLLPLRRHHESRRPLGQRQTRTNPRWTKRTSEGTFLDTSQHSLPSCFVV